MHSKNEHYLQFELSCGLLPSKRGNFCDIVIVQGPAENKKN